MSENKIIRVGSRRSELALIQTKYVISSLKEFYPNERFEIHTMTTIGDRVLNISLPKIGEKALFTKDLEDALSNGTVDFVVHSLKDLPTTLPVGMAIGAVLKREDPRDALVLNGKFTGKKLSTLPPGSIIGTSSLRRTAQLARSYSNIKVQDIRGNLNTRLAKLDADNSIFSGIMLAHAGLVRMGWQNRISETISDDDVLYAVGQGALAVECRSNDNRILAMLRKLNCVQTQCRILSERSFLKTLGGGCSAPVAVSTQLMRADTNSTINTSHQLEINGAVWSLDGKIQINGKLNCSLELEEDICEEVPKKKIRLNPSLNMDKKDENQLQIIDDTPIAANTFRIIHDGLLKNKETFDTNDVNENSSNQIVKLLFPVGHDVMGECPIYGTTEKTQLSEDIKTFGNTEPMGKTGVCPVKASTSNVNVIATNNGNAVLYFGSNSSQLSQGCPVVKSLVGSVEKNEEKRLVDDEMLYCGLYPHKSISRDLYEKCNILGKTLAKNLIAKGALDVMDAAQKEIRTNL